MEGGIDEQNLEIERDADKFEALPADETIPIPDAVTSQKLLETTDHGSLDENIQIGAQDSGYNSSGSSDQHSPGGILSGHVEDEMIRTRSRASSHTSISSIPASILTNLPDTMKPMRDTHDYVYQPWDVHSPRAVHTIRQREATFRKPSSVRAMQMHTEDEGDDEFLTPPKRRGGQRISDISIRSAGSSPLKRSPFYSPSGAVSKPKVKKEYPLVLLHCTLLSPSLPVPGLVGHPDRQNLLKEVLPSVYWKRWKLLEEKIGSGVLRDRGVLISHPEDMYDLLEERLLESLELQRPRLDHGHFLGPDETESDREDSLAHEDSCTESEGEECPDCGGRVARHSNTKKWEIKVFAANGLMRAGAWAAAWKEMEKVDVEVGLWLPADIRAELRSEMTQWVPHPDTHISVPLLQEPDVMAGTQVRALTPSPPNAEPEPRATESRETALSLKATPEDNRRTELHAPNSSQEIDLHTLLINYIRVLASDRRNVAIVFLSILLAFGAINSRAPTPASDLRPFPSEVPSYSMSSVAPLKQHMTQPLAESPDVEILSATSLEQAVVPSLTAIYGTYSNPGDDVRSAEPSAAEPEGPSTATTEALPAESTQIVPEEQVMSGEQVIPEEQAISEEQVLLQEKNKPLSTTRAVLLDVEPESQTVSAAEDVEDDQEAPAYEPKDEQGEPSEASQPTESSEPIEPTKLDEQPEEEDQTEPSEPTETTQPIEPIGLDEQLNDNGHTEPSERMESIDPIVSGELPELDDETEVNEVMGSIEPTQPAEPAELYELDDQNEQDEEHEEHEENEQT
ncbi:hypothetical protein BJX63DRAFT_72873 [Aspergillus granulosus]|uniref:Uncharacterized protein n=1 Tax=Aspergillus granulosus TaxID=176169 RepID=A0ABR4HUJ5_9EURO